MLADLARRMTRSATSTLTGCRRASRALPAARSYADRVLPERTEYLERVEPWLERPESRAAAGPVIPRGRLFSQRRP